MDENILKRIAELQIKMNDMTEDVSSIRQKINGLELDTKRCLKSNVPIPPGIGCKFAYDSNGLILKTIPLSPSDIPQLEIDSIKSLRLSLNEKISRSEFERLQIQAINGINKRSDKVFGTGCKVNFDENGFVISGLDLTKEDIPLIELEGVNGLVERLELIEASIKDKHENIDSFKINPGIGCKLSYDSKGRIIKSEDLSIDDIPRELMRQMNEIESQMTSFASQVSVNNLMKNIENKLDSNSKIQPGIFTKVTVDNKGLVTKGEKISKSDLPQFSISDIIGLESAIRNKANQSDITTIFNSIETLSSFVSKVGDINAIKTSLINKAESSEVRELKTHILGIQNSIDLINSKVPLDTINICIDNLEKEINSLLGRISVIEKKLTIGM